MKSHSTPLRWTVGGLHALADRTFRTKRSTSRLRRFVNSPARLLRTTRRSPPPRRTRRSPPSRSTHATLLAQPSCPSLVEVSRRRRSALVGSLGAHRSSGLGRSDAFASPKSLPIIHRPVRRVAGQGRPGWGQSDPVPTQKDWRVAPKWSHERLQAKWRTDRAKSVLVRLRTYLFL
jgi:hypothetical protein